MRMLTCLMKVTVAVMLVTLAGKAAADPIMFFGEGQQDAIYSADLDGSNISGKLFSGGGSPGDGVRLDVANSHTYFSDTNDGPGSLRRIDFDGSNTAMILDAGVTSGVSSIRAGFDLDLTNGHIYFGQDDGIYRSNLDGTGVTSIITDAANFGVTAITVDVANQLVYYNDRTSRDGTNDTIRSVGFDGTGDTVLFSGEDWIQAIEIDLAGGKLYWANTSDDTVKRGNVDGTGKETIVLSTETGNVRGVGLDVFGGKVYWSDAGPNPGTISYRNLDGTGSITSFNSPGNAPLDIAIYNPIPEPATLTLLVLAAAGLLRRGRRW